MSTFQKNKDINMAAMMDASNLKLHAVWIRDTLDPLIAREGPEAISVEDALYMDQFLRNLLSVTPTIQDIRLSRIHMALQEVIGKATRWPRLLIERAEAVVEAWEYKYGNISKGGVELLGPGGRLDGIANAKNLNPDTLLMKWLKQGDKLLPARARKRGDLGFKPGDWWINALFAFRDGIIDSTDGSGGIVSDNTGAYAILLTGHDELSSTSASHFTYRSHNKDKGRYRLTAANREARQPVRILRSHTLQSFWSPRAGIRYDGLYRVEGWCIKHDPIQKTVVYDIKLERLASETPIEDVLARPTTDEVEDYKEFKRLKQLSTAKIPKLATMSIPTFLLTTDGVDEQGPLGDDGVPYAKHNEQAYYSPNMDRKEYTPPYQ